MTTTIIIIVLAAISVIMLIMVLQLRADLKESEKDNDQLADAYRESCSENYEKDKEIFLLIHDRNILTAELAKYKGVRNEKGQFVKKGGSK